MSTKKIEGYVYENNLPAVGKNRLRDTTVTFFPEEDPNPNHTKATTLVIHSGLPEPVYTQSEVVAMLNDILGHAVLLGGSGKERDHVHEEDIKEVAAAHGITF